MQKVFISFCSKDTVVVDRMKSIISCWICKESTNLGNKYAEAIANAIKEMQRLFAILNGAMRQGTEQFRTRENLASPA